MRGWGKGGSDDAAGGMGGGQGRREGVLPVDVNASEMLYEAFCGRLASIFHVAMFKPYARYGQKIVGT